MGYDCPVCHWDPPCEFPLDYYIVKKRRFRKNIISVIMDFWIPENEEPLSAYIPNPKYPEEPQEKGVKTRDHKDEKGNQIYPIIKNWVSYSSYLGAGTDWTEVHCCPRHGEFKFGNGT